ncbi:hypothetical protein EG329_004127 [Mollisiaceae sp. DMI_Dod_QoI]|nr:hypothetical protein EG329_004127 [Helotiales sp. DMI_Dod_QoI]
MKPTSPLSLLLFLRLASTAPIPLSFGSIYPTDCHSKSCIISLLSSPHTNHHTPPTHFTEPHFPSHQLDDHQSQESISTSSSEDNLTPSLSSPQPLSTSYLLSLTNPASAPSIQKAPGQRKPDTTSQDLPAKPTSALTELRAADLQEYWETPRPSSPKHVQIHICNVDLTEEMVGSERFYYMRRTRMGTRRDYADLMVVGIVVLFLAVVAALEAVERCGVLGGILCGRRQGRGEIYLEDDDNLFIVKKPFELSPAPVSRNKTSVSGYSDDKAEFHYDSDANERV